MYGSSDFYLTNRNLRWCNWVISITFGNSVWFIYSCACSDLLILFSKEDTSILLPRIILTWFALKCQLRPWRGSNVNSKLKRTLQFAMWISKFHSRNSPIFNQCSVKFHGVRTWLPYLNEFEWVAKVKIVFSVALFTSKGGAGRLSQQVFELGITISNAYIRFHPLLKVNQVPFCRESRPEDQRKKTSEHNLYCECAHASFEKLPFISKKSKYAAELRVF